MLKSPAPGRMWLLRDPQTRSAYVFFAMFAVAGFQGRFLSLFYRDRGMSDFETGCILSVSSLVLVFAGRQWTAWADDCEAKTAKAYLLALSVFCAEVPFALQCLVDFGWIPDRLVFGYLLLLRAAAACFFAAWHPLANAIGVEDLLDTHGPSGPTLFGGERLWGAVSWLLVHLCQGPLIDWYGTYTLYFGHALATCIAVYVLCNWLAIKRPAEGIENEATSRVFTPVTPRGTVCCGAVDTAVVSIVHRTYETLAFFALMLVSAAGMSQVENLLFLFMTDELEADGTVCGLSVVVTVLLEIAFFSVGPDLLAAFGEHVLLVAACLTFVVRVWLYTVVPNWGYILLVEPLHGVTIATITLGGNAFVLRHAPKGLEANAQALLVTVRTGLGYFLGTFSGGYIMGAKGGRHLYRLSGLIVLIFTAVYALVAWREHRQRRPGASSEREPIVKPTRC
ncbi:putative transporter YwbF [Diplonema papillatum]|nr:putative transporter YwbF [Diplonema papillatum]